MRVYMHSCVVAHAYVCVCGSQRPVSGAVPQMIVYFFFLRQSLSFYLGLTSLGRLGGQ